MPTNTTSTASPAITLLIPRFCIDIRYGMAAPLLWGLSRPRFRKPICHLRSNDPRRSARLLKIHFVTEDVAGEVALDLDVGFIDNRLHGLVFAQHFGGEAADA